MVKADGSLVFSTDQGHTHHIERQYIVGVRSDEGSEGITVVIGPPVGLAQILVLPEDEDTKVFLALAGSHEQAS